MEIIKKMTKLIVAIESLFIYIALRFTSSTSFLIPHSSGYAGVWPWASLVPCVYLYYLI